MSLVSSPMSSSRRRPLEIDVIPVAALSPTDCTDWISIQESSSLFESPFFSPYFTQAVASARNDVYVARLHVGNETVGYFPFQRSRFGIGKPVGGILSDYQGVVVRPGVTWNAIDLIRACGLAAWDFDHLIAAQTEFDFHSHSHSSSPVMDLSEGFRHYLATRDSSHNSHFKSLERSMRRLQRDHGPVTFHDRVLDLHRLNTLKQWKSSQYRRTGQLDLFSVPWINTVVDLVHRADIPCFSGALLSLENAGRPIALRFGMRTCRGFHAWFSSYDQSLARYSPGLLLFYAMAKSAEAIGLSWIDLGKGGQSYKRQLMSRSVQLCEGSVVSSRALSRGRDIWAHCKNTLRNSPLRSPAKHIVARAHAVTRLLHLP